MCIISLLEKFLCYTMWIYVTFSHTSTYANIYFNLTTKLFMSKLLDCPVCACPFVFINDNEHLFVNRWKRVPHALWQFISLFFSPFVYERCATCSTNRCIDTSEKSPNLPEKKTWKLSLAFQSHPPPITPAITDNLT